MFVVGSRVRVCACVCVRFPHSLSLSQHEARCNPPCFGSGCVRVKMQTTIGDFSSHGHTPYGIRADPFCQTIQATNDENFKSISNG